MNLWMRGGERDRNKYTQAISKKTQPNGISKSAQNTRNGGRISGKMESALSPFRRVVFRVLLCGPGGGWVRSPVWEGGRFLIGCPSWGAVLIFHWLHLIASELIWTRISW